MPENESSGVIEARETFHILMEMSRLLNTGLDADTLMCCVRLIEAGINPEALSVVIKELRREASTLTEQKPSDKDNKKD